jgi:putative endonuclease
MEKQFYTYILTNRFKTVLYTGITNSLPRRLQEHYFERGSPKTFAGKYNCHWLIYYEIFKYVRDAISREKQIKGWTRAKKNELIDTQNPSWKFRNTEIMVWPPDVPSLRSG